MGELGTVVCAVRRSYKLVYAYPRTMSLLSWLALAVNMAHLLFVLFLKTGYGKYVGLRLYGSGRQRLSMSFKHSSNNVVKGMSVLAKR